jgi:hypothetical protein
VLARLGKPLHWIGFNDASHTWEPIAEDGDGAYQHIRVGLQLVDRKGRCATPTCRSSMSRSRIWRPN